VVSIYLGRILHNAIYDDIIYIMRPNESVPGVVLTDLAEAYVVLDALQDFMPKDDQVEALVEVHRRLMPAAMGRAVPKLVECALQRDGKIDVTIPFGVGETEAVRSALASYASTLTEDGLLAETVEEMRTNLDADFLTSDALFPED